MFCVTSARRARPRPYGPLAALAIAQRRAPDPVIQMRPRRVPAGGSGEKSPTLSHARLRPRPVNQGEASAPGAALISPAVGSVRLHADPVPAVCRTESAPRARSRGALVSSPSRGRPRAGARPRR